MVTNFLNKSEHTEFLIIPWLLQLMYSVFPKANICTVTLLFVEGGNQRVCVCVCTHARVSSTSLCFPTLLLLASKIKYLGHIGGSVQSILQHFSDVYYYFYRYPVREIKGFGLNEPGCDFSWDCQRGAADLKYEST